MGQAEPFAYRLDSRPGRSLCKLRKQDRCYAHVRVSQQPRFAQSRPRLPDRLRKLLCKAIRRSRPPIRRHRCRRQFALGMHGAPISRLAPPCAKPSPWAKQPTPIVATSPATMRTRCSAPADAGVDSAAAKPQAFALHHSERTQLHPHPHRARTARERDRHRARRPRPRSQLCERHQGSQLASSKAGQDFQCRHHCSPGSQHGAEEEQEPQPTPHGSKATPSPGL